MLSYIVAPERRVYKHEELHTDLIMHRQSGGSLPHFHSAVAFQRGHGLGGVLGKFLRYIVPILKKPVVKRTLKRVGRAALHTGLDTLNTPARKRSLKESVRKNILRQVVRPALNPSSTPRKTPTPQSRHRRERKTLIANTGKRVRQTPARKTRKLDVFDF